MVQMLKAQALAHIEGNMLTVSWPVSIISKNWSISPFKKSFSEVLLFDDTKDVISDLNEFIALLKQLT